MMNTSLRTGLACLAYIALLLGAIVCASLWRARAVTAEKEVTRLHAEAKLSVKVLANHTKARQKTQAQAAKAAEAVASAVANNQSWADTPVPEEVQRALK